MEFLKIYKNPLAHPKERKEKKKKRNCSQACILYTVISDWIFAYLMPSNKHFLQFVPSNMLYLHFRICSAVSSALLGMLLSD